MPRYKKTKFVSEWQKKSFIDPNPEAPRFRCLLKLHKEGKPLRPIVSFINSPSYGIAKEISKQLRKLYEMEISHSIKNAKCVIEKLKGIDINNNTKLMSLDVKDMFTNIPINKTINLIKGNNLGGFEYKNQFIDLILVCVKQNYFRFNNKYYIQGKGLPIGSPLSPFMADIFMNS